MKDNMNTYKRILVTGGRGLVGSAIVRKLRECGYDNILAPSHQELDLLNEDATTRYINDHNPDIVICAAAKVGGIGGNSKDNYGFLNQNLIINQNTINASFKCGVQNLVFLGSSCIYPKYATQPIKEGELLQGGLEPTNEGYALAKITGIKLCEFLRRQYGVRYYSLMPCNLYGIGDNYNIVSGHVLPTLISKFVNANENNQPTVTLWGDGTPLREFLYSDDLADAVVKSLDIEFNKLPDLMNIGSSTEVSIRELATTIQRIVGYDGELVWDSTKPNGTPRKVMDSSLFKSLTNWTPNHTLEDGIRLCLNDYLENRSKLRA